MPKTARPFAVRYRDDPGGRRKLSSLRFADSVEAHEYARRLIDSGARNVTVVQLDGRRYKSQRSVVR